MFSDTLADPLLRGPRGACARGGRRSAPPRAPPCGWPCWSASAAFGRLLAAGTLPLGGLGEVSGLHREQILRVDVTTHRRVDGLGRCRADALLEFRIPHEVPSQVQVSGELVREITV